VSRNVAAGDTILVAVNAGTFVGAVGCSDSKGNTYSVDSDVTANGRLFVCSARNVTALGLVDTITATYPGFSGLSVAVATEFSGVTTLDQSLAASGNDASPTVGPVVTTQSTELLISVVSHTSTPVFTPGCGFVAASWAIAGSGSSQKTIDVSYQVVSATGSYSACGTMTAGQWWSAEILTYY